MRTENFVAASAVAVGSVLTSTANAQFNIVSRDSHYSIFHFGGTNTYSYTGPGLWTTGSAFGTPGIQTQVSNVTSSQITIDAYSEQVGSGQNFAASVNYLTVVFNIASPTQVHIEMFASTGTSTQDGWISTLSSSTQTVDLPAGTSGPVAGSLDVTLSPGQWTFNLRTRSPSHTQYSITAVPAPASAALLGAAGLAAARRRRVR